MKMLSLTEDKVAVAEDEMHRQLWMAECLGELLKAAPILVESPPKGAFARTLIKYMEQYSAGCVEAFAVKVEVLRPTLQRWLRREVAPQSDLLLRACFRIGATLLDLITGRLPEPSFVKESATSNQTLVVRRDRPQRRDITPSDAASMRREFRKALKEYPPPCLKEVARRMGRNPNSVQYRFPELSNAVISRYLNHRKASRRELCEQMLKALEIAMSEENPPLPLDLARSRGWSHKILRHRFPKQCRTLTRRCAEMRGERWKRLEQLLEAALREEPPPSVKALAKRYEVDDSILYRRFPELCRRISARRKSSRGPEA
jgi:hypothetical protein